MRLSVSQTDDDVAILDAYVRTKGLPSRSAALSKAVRRLRLPDLEDDYASAWTEWDATGEAEAWEATTADGVTDAAR